MSIDYDGLVTQGLAKQISEKFRDAILEGRLQVHERLPTEEELAVRFNVSRPTIREALKRLAAQNLIRSRRGPAGGTFVTRPTHDEARAAVANAATLLVSMGEFALPDIAEARQALELVCCELASKRRTDAHLAAMAQEIALQRDPSLSDVDFCAADVRFHRTLVEAAGNPALSFAASSLLDSLQPAVNLIIFRHRDRKQVAAQHERIRAALESRDAGTARAALTDYMNALRRQSRKAQQERAGAEAPSVKRRQAGRGSHG